VNVRIARLVFLPSLAAGGLLHVEKILVIAVVAVRTDMADPTVVIGLSLTFLRRHGCGMDEGGRIQHQKLVL
jgi:hypothetical protein